MQTTISRLRVRRIKLPVSVAIFAVLLLVEVFATGNGKNLAISDEYDAVTRIRDFIGLSSLKSISPMTASKYVTRSIITENDTPFLGESLEGRTVWNVAIPILELTRNNAVAGEFSNGRRLENVTVTMDSASGAMIRFQTTLDVPDSNLAPEPPCSVATEEMTGRGPIIHEQYIAFLAEAPTISLREALESAVPCSPFVAKEILAYPVQYSQLQRDTIPVWVIMSRGITTFDMLRYPDEKYIPIYMRNRQRCLVDAESGKLLAITNSPQVLHQDSVYEDIE